MSYKTKDMVIKSLKDELINQENKFKESIKLWETRVRELNGIVEEQDNRISKLENDSNLLYINERSLSMSLDKVTKELDITKELYKDLIKSLVEG